MACTRRPRRDFDRRSPVARLQRWWPWLALLVLSGWCAGCAGLPANVERTPSRAFASPGETALGRLAAARRAQAGARAQSGFTLLDSVEAAFSSRLALIETAQRTLDLQYYAIHADASTEVLLDRLRDAARRGVRVRILLDDFNTVGEDAQVLRLAFEPNVEVRLFNPLPGSRGSLIARVLGSLHDVGRIQKRMHNKLFLADSAWGITGGRNLGDAYFGTDDKSNFVDLDVLAAGAVVQRMAASFDRYWNDELAYPVQALLDPQDLDRLRKREPQAPEQPADRASPHDGPARRPAPTPGNTVLPNVTPAAADSAQRPPMDLQRVPMAWAPAVLLVDKPDKIAAEDDPGAGETVIDGLLQVMQQARQEVLIVSPYFVPGAQMMAEFAELRRRGVTVRVLTNSLASNDAPATHAGYRRYRRDLLQMGVELHEMRADPASAGLPGGGSGDRGGSRKASRDAGLSLGSAAGGSKSGSSRASLHSKAVIVDRSLSVIGSMNLDLRSQLQNSEVALVIRSKPLGSAAAELIERSIRHGAYRLEMAGSGLAWRAPAGAAFDDATSEPEAPLRLRLLVNLLAPFAPDEML